MAVIRIENGPLAGRVHRVGAEPITIGRDASATIRVEDAGVSREHAEVFRVGEMCFVKDLGSRNGTFLRGKPVTEEILQVGDRFQVGSTHLVFEESDPDAVADRPESVHRIVVALCRRLFVDHETGRAAELGVLLADAGRALTDAGPVPAAVRAADFLSGVEGLAGAAEAVRHQFERFDGTGRPAGLAGQAIPLAARILAVARARFEEGDLTDPGLDPSLVGALRTTSLASARSYIEEEPDA